jgi:signal transduction histidine kinase
MSERNHQIRVEIEDWGRGFDPQAAAPERFGLQGIRQRAQLFGGRATIHSAAGEGTRITVELPLVERAAEETPDNS